MILNKKLIACSALLLILFSACKKSNYQDGGVLSPKYNGSTMDYLLSKPDVFDSLTKIIKLAGLEQMLRNEDVTFFVPPNPTIQSTIRLANLQLRSVGKDTIYRLEQVKPEVWKRALGKYIFKHKKSLNDYPQIDFQNIPVYPGQPYVTMDGTVMNIGVNYLNAGGVQYAGLRTIYISYIPSLSAPTNWISSDVSTSNIETNNGFMHVLRYAFIGTVITTEGSSSLDLNAHNFGFDPFQFYNDALDYGIDP